MNLMKSMVFAGLVAVSSMPVLAVTDAPLKVGVVDFRQVMQKAPEARTAASKLKKQFKPRQAKIISKNKKLDKEVTQLKRDGSVMSAAKRDKDEAKILADKRQLQRLREEFQQDYMLAENKMLRNIKQKLAKAVDKIAKKDHYDLILPKGHVPYVNKKIDITKQVIKEMKS